MVYSLLENNIFIGCPSLTSRNAMDGCKIPGTKIKKKSYMVNFYGNRRIHDEIIP